MSGPGALLAVVPGAVVWSVLAVGVVAWTVATLLAGPARLPGPVDVVRFFLRSWLGRALALLAWAAAGWHVFCQRP
ncbi:MAG TPA: hypothetical protein VK277_14545 [Acidimicrobiales bacterium]|nr:hypothetical protein [Acidimicrobiales bacterium]